MTQEEALIGALLDESWLTLEQLAAACAADVGWLQQHLEAGLLPQAQSLGGVWRFSSATLRLSLLALTLSVIILAVFGLILARAPAGARDE